MIIFLFIGFEHFLDFFPLCFFCFNIFFTYFFAILFSCWFQTNHLRKHKTYQLLFSFSLCMRVYMLMCNKSNCYGYKYRRNILFGFLLNILVLIKNIHRRKNGVQCIYVNVQFFKCIIWSA